MAAYPATYEDSIGLCQTVMRRARQVSARQPRIEWRVPIRGVVFAGPLESLQAQVVPDERLDPSVAAPRDGTTSSNYSPAGLRRVGDRYEAVGAEGRQTGLVLLDDNDGVPTPPADGWPPIPTRRFGGHDSSLFFELREGTLTFVLPVDVLRRSSSREAELTVSVDLATERARLRLSLDGEVTESAFHHHLEGAIPGVEGALGEPVKLHCCFNCSMSDYFHGGTGLSGMFCFRDSRQAYRSVRSKADYVRLVPDAITEFVDELYVCREFEQRQPGTGYRG
ncbi:MAG: hypothetical protein M3450_01190 [Actinomycetota bacterium]|nr:hypothetical protein [Actinomycetota bacterium]